MARVGRVRMTENLPRAAPLAPHRGEISGYFLIFDSLAPIYYRLMNPPRSTHDRYS